MAYYYNPWERLSVYIAENIELIPLGYSESIRPAVKVMLTALHNTTVTPDNWVLRLVKFVEQSPYPRKAQKELLGIGLDLVIRAETTYSRLRRTRSADIMYSTLKSWVWEFKQYDLVKPDHMERWKKDLHDLYVLLAVSSCRYLCIPNDSDAWRVRTTKVFICSKYIEEVDSIVKSLLTSTESEQSYYLTGERYTSMD